MFDIMFINIKDLKIAVGEAYNRLIVMQQIESPKLHFLWVNQNGFSYCC